ncbi:MAPEG family protein [Colwelliaceae bacterium 6441]
MFSQMLIQPALAMLSLTFIVAMAMMWTRVKAMKAHKVSPERAEDASMLKGLLPRETMRISDNYNHLHEQPIVFYALCGFITMTNNVDGIFVYLAWAYVLVRVFHSITQVCLVNVMRRFVLFLCSWLLLGAILIRFVLQLI